MFVQTHRRAHLAALLLVSLVAIAPFANAQTAPGATKQLSATDLKAWKSIRQPTLSNDGKWFVYTLAPNEGDATLVVRSTGTDGKETKFSIGDAATNGPLAVSGDSRWVAYTIAPAFTNGRGGRGARGGGGAQAGAPAAPPQNKMGLINLATGEKKEFDRVRRFAFNGDKPTWIVMQSYPEAAASPADAAAAAAAGRGGRGGAPAGGGGSASDIVLYKLESGELVNVGNVADFAFDDSGEWLAYVIDAREQNGNGVQLRNMRTDVVRSLDSDRAMYRSLAWSDSGYALAVLRGKLDSLTRDTLFTVVSFNNVSVPSPKKNVFDPSNRRDFPAGMKVAAERTPRFSDDYNTVFFGIKEAKRPEPATQVAGRGTGLVQAGAPGMGGSINQPRVNEATEENPSLILWHAKDPRLQSQQIVQEAQDRAFNYLSEYRIVDDKFVRLSDDELRSVAVTPHDRAAFGIDTRAYDQPASYSGRRYEDLYSVDLGTGQRKLLAKKRVATNMIPEPNGKRALYWGEDAQWWVIDLATGETKNLTKNVPAIFADTSDDHNTIVRPPNPVVGWSKDASAVLLSDGFDVWKVPVNGGTAVNLTVDGKKNGVRYQRLYAFESDAAGGGAGRGGRGGRGGGGAINGIDLSQPLYFGTYGERTKKEGLAKVDASKPGAQVLVWEDAKFSFQKAKDADVYLYTRQSATDFPNYWVANSGFKGGRQITDANPQQKEFAWTSGVRLVNYTSAKGDKLQGALYLPANYQPGKKYPMLVTIYEKRSNLAHAYVMPNETSTPNRSIYTSRGYVVFDPDIVYKINDPGMSAVWCVVPAVQAAIATGIVDSSHVGLWGHSWGGYQTAFLVTQTNIFKAAIAGAPLTDMVSMYSSIYWNTGGTNQAIFESSQGRFKGNYADNYEAYIRNSPVFHAKNVKTPLIILHDDKDGAVDFNQGITYFNTLRQMDKDVILLEYVGENHGLARPINMKDYAMRQKDWFDHYLKDVPAPDWMTKGIPRIKMDEYWRSLKDSTKTVP